MSATYASLAASPVRQLLIELAEQDARAQSVNDVLYQRSAAYQQTLDAELGRRGQRVCREAGGLRVTASRARRFHQQSGYARPAAESEGRGEWGGPCRRLAADYC
jgi:hypothetical protein